MYKLNLRGLKDEGYEVDFLHGYCQYLAIVMAEEYGTKVGLWIDYDDEIEKEVLVHSFVVLRDGLYMDASGIFRSIEEVEENFDYYDTDIGIVDIETAKKILRKLRVPYGDKRIKDFVRKRVREKGHDRHRRCIYFVLLFL